MMEFSAKQWLDAFMAADHSQLVAMIVEAGGEPDWKEVFLVWLDTKTCDADAKVCELDVYYLLLVAAKFNLLPFISAGSSGDRHQPSQSETALSRYDRILSERLEAIRRSTEFLHRACEGTRSARENPLRRYVREASRWLRALWRNGRAA